jgi:hypothetical protein
MLVGLGGSEEVPDYRNIGAEASERGTRRDIAHNGAVPVTYVVVTGFRDSQERQPRG